ncbi:Fe-S cluster assembly protein SufD [Mechercharimyces sp. CAU 1602]|uniref:Fe-S cluster assembly protein SufD n=1 Tax=Mechercharimyces sp. CAU 1602 TaxID=2973933 RepID=UPI0021622E2D|nr:Fe-S cluster assembly protein SufD [Mechercharimyces sp. CAU 1602]MCS1351895.1 Fe-S cluster assembly protein SufD [Mechercharimyces sp. CAU 1602]
MQRSWKQKVTIGLKKNWVSKTRLLDNRRKAVAKMTTELEKQINPEIVTQLSQSQQEPEWMLQFRLQALESAKQLSLPRVEKTNINKWNFSQFSLKSEQEVADTSALPQEVLSLMSDEENASLVVQKNSSVIWKNASRALEEQGVIFTDLGTAVREHSELVKKYFGQAVAKDEHQLSAMHGALWSGGLFLYVPKNVDVQQSLQAIFYNEGNGVGIMPHVLVVTEENSRVNLVCNYTGDSEASAVVQNSVVEVFVGAGSHVSVATLHNLGEDSVDVAYRRAMVGRDGYMEWIVGELNHGRTLSDNTTHLTEPGGHTDVRTIAVGSGSQRSNLTSAVYHVGTDTESDMNVRGVMKDKAQTIMNGITKIEKGAKRANGVQAEKVLMLDRGARGDANPILLIDENDVKAGHAASVGQIDPMQLFYLMSRGIPKREAEKLVIYGFLGPVLDAIPFEAIRKQMVSVIERKLSQ